MPNQLISIRMPEVLLKDIELLRKDGGYGSSQEYIRDAVREAVRKQKLRQSLLELDKLVGSGKKRVKFVSKKDMEAYIMKKFG